MYIKRIETTPFELEMHGALRWGKFGELKSIEHMLVKVEDQEGNIGISEAPVRPTIYGETRESITAIVQLFSTKLIGLSSDDEEIYNVLDSIPNNHCAKGAIDMAIYDLRAKQRQQNIVDAYAGEKNQIRVSYILGISNIETMLQEAKRVFANGVSVFKIKIGRDSQHDEQIIQALKTEFSDEVILYVDANETLDAKEAPARLEKLANLGVAYIEEPLPVHLIKEREYLRSLEILPIIGDDSCFTLNDLQRELQCNTFDILNIKTARSGFYYSFKMLEEAKKHHKGVMLGSQASCGLGTIFCAIMASQEGVTHPCELSFPLKLKTHMLQKPINYNNGFLDIHSLRDYKLLCEL
ncbi:mandelate racemase/muconate lactonizing enzyme family protein [Candidatus Uabimicrobium amorphum]|uniref:Chloromuconate cycloisomerase n=1 Tax=Uabimicrobium amorphum TaxID=2596890 RepID=A0A5S9IJJ4_UABAM|nr:enolase C-terminal domain-like protein [Candidatus Uabimicrobium amorphum]BBM82552.1 chloromuconate cycloisomerase [Candidatus Uabimicrobium amorphum]